MNQTLKMAVVALLAAGSLAACDRNADGTVSARTDGRTVGEKVDTALEKTQAGLERAGDKIQPTLDRAGDKIAAAATSDGAITTSIKADYLKDPDLSVLKIDVDTKDGVVTLNGSAETAAAKDRAEKLAGAIKGVREVRNNLSVKQG